MFSHLHSFVLDGNPDNGDVYDVYIDFGSLQRNLEFV